MSLRFSGSVFHNFHELTEDGFHLNLNLKLFKKGLSVLLDPFLRFRGFPGNIRDIRVHLEFPTSMQHSGIANYLTVTAPKKKNQGL